MAFEPLHRTNYPDQQQSTHADRDHFRDFRDYHLPLSRMHHAHLHNWGIARGLEVRGALGGNVVVVQPGVAVDVQGQLIVLTQEVSRSTSIFPNESLYVTLKFAEEATPEGRLAHKPEVRVQTVSAVEGSSETALVVLALVETDNNGRVVALRERASGRRFRRQLLGGQFEAVEIQRSVREEDRLGTVTAGTIAAGETGGLRITVPGASDTVVVGREDGGQVARVELRADQVAIPGALGLGGDLNVAGTIQGTLAHGTVGPDQLAAQAVINAKIADQAVTSNKIAPGVIRDIGITVMQTLQDGQSIPIPRGFQRSDCVFYVALKYVQIDPELGRVIYNCGVDANGRVSTSDPGRVLAMGVAMAKRGGW